MKQMSKFEFGIYSLGERIPDANGSSQTAVARVEDIMQKWQMKQDLIYSVLGNITGLIL